MTNTVTVSTGLAADADDVWHALRSPQTFVHVAGAMARYPAAERLDRGFVVGDVLEGWTFLLRVIPFAHHTLRVIDINDADRTLLTHEGGGLVRTWNHEIRVTPMAAGRCHYVDEIEIDAGVFTPVVVGFAHVFYRYRQRRWRQLATLLADAAVARQSSTAIAA